MILKLFLGSSILILVIIWNHRLKGGMSKYWMLHYGIKCRSVVTIFQQKHLIDDLVVFPKFSSNLRITWFLVKFFKNFCDLKWNYFKLQLKSAHKLASCTRQFSTKSHSMFPYLWNMLSYLRSSFNLWNGNCWYCMANDQINPWNISERTFACFSYRKCVTHGNIKNVIKILMWKSQI